MRRPLPLGLSPRSGRSLAPGRLFRAALRAPNIPLTAAPHGVGCEVTRGDPGGGGEHSSAGVSTVFPLLARSPPPSRQPHPLGLSSLLPPAPPPPFQARPWPPNSRSSLRERAAARRFSRASGGGGSAPTFATQGLAAPAWAPTTPDSVGLASPYLSRELRGAQCVSASVSVSVSVSLSCRVCRV